MKEGEKVKIPGLDRMWKPATKDEVSRFDAAAYEILRDVGVYIDDKDIISTFKDTPVEIDEKELIVKFPEDWIREMIKKAPRSYSFAGRNPNRDMTFADCTKDQYNGLTSEATKMFIWNENTNQWDSVDPGIEDVIKAVKIVDAIDAYDSFQASPIADMESTKAGLPGAIHTLYGKLVGSTKFTGGCAITENGVEEWDYAAKIAAEVQGGLDELAKRPILFGLPSCIGPLQCTRQNFWAMLGPAKHHIPTNPYYGGTQPFTAPATLAGAMALALACNYFCMAVSQFLDPGTATLPTAFSLAASPRSGQLVMAPFLLMSEAVQAQVLHDLYNLHICEYTNSLTCSLEEQAAQMMAQYVVSTITGTNYIMVDPSPQAFMWEGLIMCEEIINFCKQLLFQFGDMNPTDENLALDVMKEVGPKKQFTTHKHTLKHISPKKGLFWEGKTWIKSHADKWRDEGAERWLYDAARARLKELEKHEPEPLPKDVVERMDAILKEADDKLSLF
jgi:trimethylamine--corrinoid protein Co-methyltransferase